MQKDKTVRKSSSPVEESKSGESPPASLNSVGQSLCSDESRVASVDGVGEAQSRLAVEQELGKHLDAKETEACNQKLNYSRFHKSTAQSVDRVGEAQSSLAVEQELGKQLDAEEKEACNQKRNSLRFHKSIARSVDRVGDTQSRLVVEQELRKQLDAKETEACNQKLNSTVAQECGKKTVVERRDAACVVNPSFVTSQEGIKKSHLKELEVRLKKLSSSLIERYIRQSNFTEVDDSSEHSSDNAVLHVEQSGTVPVGNVSSVVLPANADGPSSCDTSNLTHAPANTALGAGEGNTLVSTTDCMVLGRKS